MVVVTAVANVIVVVVVVVLVVSRGNSEGFVSMAGKREGCVQLKVGEEV